MLNDKEKIGVALAMVSAMADAIRDLGTVPSGHLYAMGWGGNDLAGYEVVIQILIDAKLVKKDGSHLLTWIGPAK